MLRDLDDLIVPALTNWQHPRFFAYFAVTASEPGILAELIAASLNQVAIVWRASPASTELELRVVDWVRQLLGLPDGWHGHIEDTASTSTLAALIAARHVTGRNVVVCSEHAHSSVEKDARMLPVRERRQEQLVEVAEDVRERLGLLGRRRRQLRRELAGVHLGEHRQLGHPLEVLRRPLERRGTVPAEVQLGHRFFRSLSSCFHVRVLTTSALVSQPRRACATANST